MTADKSKINNEEIDPRETADEESSHDDDGGRPEQADDASPDTDEVSDKTVNSEPAEEKDDADRYLRLAAEFDNYKKRTAREFSDVVKMANERLLKSLVEIMDNFERALGTEVREDNGEAYRKGVELIYNQLAELLKKENVSPIAAVGEPFDPSQHEAMMQAASDDFEEGIVCQEIQKGYRLGDRVLRHARVVVSSGPPESGPSPSHTEE